MFDWKCDGTFYGPRMIEYTVSEKADDTLISADVKWLKRTISIFLLLNNRLGEYVKDLAVV